MLTLAAVVDFHLYVFADPVVDCASMYQFVYGYEASLYKALQPNANHDWNGSILGIGTILFFLPPTRTHLHIA
jgi:hypothetical protein